MPIDLYYLNLSPPCRAVLMTAKELNIKINIKNVDLANGEHLNEEYLKINLDSKVPAINDDGFILSESRAIMQYLCNKYAPNNALYPKEPKMRALVDRWLNSDLSLFAQIGQTLVYPILNGTTPDEFQLKSLHDAIKLLDQLIGDNKYLVGNHLTIADLSVLATTTRLTLFGNEFDLTNYSHLNVWSTQLQSELPYYDEVNKFSKNEIAEFIAKIQKHFTKLALAK